MYIAVICGGLSAERDVSISSGTGAARALRARGHKVALVDLFLGNPSAMSAARQISITPGPMSQSPPRWARILARSGSVSRTE